MNDPAVLDAIRTVLGAAAAERRTLTYDQLLAALAGDARTAAAGPGALAPLLRELSIAEDEAGRSLLTAIVVRNGPDGLPGQGWFRLAEERGRDVSDRQVAWRREVDAVFAAWSRGRGVGSVHP